MTVDVIIPAYKPGEVLRNLLWMLKKQTVPVHRIIVVVTECEGASYPDFDSFGIVELYTVKPEEFDHGGTRAFAANMSDADYLLFMTQDAEPKDTHMIEQLLKAFEPGYGKHPDAGMVAVAYARQLPKPDCRKLEAFTRQFNYPDQSALKSRKDIEKLGIKTFFCSNVTAMYDRRIYDHLGGFVEKTIFNEDMLFAAKAVEAGYSIAYVAEAAVIHSHNLTGKQQFQRNFDLGVSQADNPEVFEQVSSTKEGGKLVKTTFMHFLKAGEIGTLFLLFYQSAMKASGYFLGKRYRKLPKKLAMACSSNKTYWK